MEQPYHIVLCTCPTHSAALDIAQHAIELKLAACANLIPGITSVYRWEDKIEQSQEILLLLKTDQHSYPDLAAMIHMRHPYSVPEIITIPITQGAPAYLSWMAEQLGNTTS